MLTTWIRTAKRHREDEYVVKNIRLAIALVPTIEGDADSLAMEA